MSRRQKGRSTTKVVKYGDSPRITDCSFDFPFRLSRRCQRRRPWRRSKIEFTAVSDGRVSISITIWGRHFTNAAFDVRHELGIDLGFGFVFNPGHFLDM